MERLWRECIESVERVWRECLHNVEIVWIDFGESVCGLLGECGESVGECGKGVGIVW